MCSILDTGSCADDSEYAIGTVVAKVPWKTRISIVLANILKLIKSLNRPWTTCNGTDLEPSYA